MTAPLDLAPLGHSEGAGPTWRFVVPFQVARTCPLPAAMHMADMAIKTLYKEAEERGLRLGPIDVLWHSPVLSEGDFRLSVSARILDQ